MANPWSVEQMAPVVGLPLSNFQYPPNLLPLKRSIQSLMEDQLAGILEDVMDAQGDGDRYSDDLLPKEYRLATFRQFEQVQVWPTLTITGGELRTVNRAETRGRSQQPGSLIRWSGVIYLDMFHQDGDQDWLAQMLDYYGAAMWLVLLKNDPIHDPSDDNPRFDIDYESSEIEVSEPGGVNMTDRAVEVRTRIEFWS